MTQNLTHAFKEWVKRSPDESFKSLESLFRFTDSRRQRSYQYTAPLSELSIESSEGERLYLNGNQAPSALTNWSFGQLSSIVGAPARYLRGLPPDLVRDCLSHGISQSDSQCKILYRDSIDPDTTEGKTAAAFTSPSYGRLWDSYIVEQILEATRGSAWRNPAELSDAPFGTPAGLYASDRDMFAFMVNEEDAVDVGGAKLGRGFFCWNSETGSATFGLMTFLYNYVCSNHIVWGAENVNEINIYHRSRARDQFVRSAMPALDEFVRNSSNESKIKSMVQRSREELLGMDYQTIENRLSPGAFTRAEVKGAWEAAKEQDEDPRTVWGMVQGLTSIAKAIPYTNVRVNLERRAGVLLKAA